MSASVDLDEYLNYLQSVRRYSSATLDGYRRDITRFIDYAHTQGLHECSDIRSHHVASFIGIRRRQGISSRSIQRTLSSLRGFYRYLIRQRKVSENPVQDVHAPKSRKRLPVVLEVDVMSKLLEFPVNNDPLLMRDRAIMELAYSSGLRLSELVSLDCQQLDLTSRQVIVEGKGSKTRYLPVGRKATLALKDWLAARTGLVKEGEKALFISQRGVRISNRAVQKRIAEHARRSGIGVHVHPHRLRHSFASHLLESSGELRAVQELLGHANISTTQVYTQLDFQHLSNVYDRAHPRARK